MDDVLKEYFSGDEVAKNMGMQIIDATPGAAVIEMTVDERHLNGMGIAHGAAIFALADFCHAVSSNAGGVVAVALHCGISYFRAVHPGTKLTASSKERHASARIAEYDINVHDGEGNLVASMTGMVYRKKESIPEAIAKRKATRQAEASS